MNSHYFTILAFKVFSGLLMAMTTSCLSSIDVPLPEQLPPFLEHRELLTHQPERAPFLLIWVPNSDHLDRLKEVYLEIVVSPVTTAYFEQDIESPIPSSTIEKMAGYLRNEFINAIRNDKNGHLEVVEIPSQQSFVVELALIKLEPTIAEINVVANVAGLVVPGALPITVASSVAGGATAHEIGKGRIAFALKLRDAATGEILAECYDEREDRGALVNAADFTRLGNSRLIIRNWAAEFTQLLDTPGNVKVERPFPFSLFLI